MEMDGKKHGKAKGSGSGKASGSLARNPEWLVSWLAANKRHIAAFFALSVIIVCAFFVFAALSQQPNYTITNASKGKSVKTYMEIADNDFARMRGLMFRDKIIPILFVFGSDGTYPIHSNFVKAPFDAVYLSENGTVVEIFRKIPPATQLVSPKKPARYLLELPTDTFDSLSIQVGDELVWKKIGEKG